MSTQSASNRNYVLQLAAAILGIGISLYLLVQHTRLKSGIQDSASFCTVGRFADCDVVNGSKYSEILGLPVASLGALFFFIILMVLLSSPTKSADFLKSQSKLAWWCLLGLGIDGYLLIIQLVILRTLCLMCAGTYVLNIFVVMLIFSNFREGQGWSMGIRRALTMKGWPVFRLSEKTIYLIAAVCFSASLLLIPSSIRLKSQLYSMMNNAIDQYFTAWNSKPAKEIPISSKDGSFGNLNAPIKIVAFSDYECPFCRKTAFTFHAVLKGLGNDVQFVFKNFPLDSSCNSSLQQQMHPMACRLAQLSYCAQEKGRFPEFHDTAFFDMGDGKLPTWEKVKSRLSDIFSSEEISACLAKDTAKQQIQDDLALGRRIGVRGTPAIFINGKRLDKIPITIETLSRLIELEKGQ